MAVFVAAAPAEVVPFKTTKIPHEDLPDTGVDPEVLIVLPEGMKSLEVETPNNGIFVDSKTGLTVDVRNLVLSTGSDNAPARTTNMEGVSYDLIG